MTTALFKDIETSIKSNLVKTSKSLKIAVAWFTNPAIFDVIMKLENLGIKIEIILSDDRTNFKNENLDFQKLIDNGTEIRISKFPNLMHHKFCIIDDRLLISGSYNWTLRAEFNNYENIIISNELNLISQFKFEFENLKRITDKLINITKTKFSNYPNLG